jgi:two-component system, cell cycle sensor histidine kinase and response regulator CckA
MAERLRILHLEDDPQDAELVRERLAAEGLDCDVVVVENRQQFTEAIRGQRFDLVLSDFTLPSYDGRSALQFLRDHCPHVPCIFYSGTLGEEAAVESLKAGATDYVLKEHPSRLMPAVRRALNDAQERAERRRVEEALRDVQERFRGVFESSKDAIGYATLDGTFLDVNPAFETLTGYSKEELLATTHQALTPAEYRRIDADIRDRLLGTGEAVEYEKEYLRKDGRRVPVSLTTFLVKGSNGEAAGLAAIIKDVTERKRTEEELKTAEAQLRQAQKLEGIGQLAGGIAHDFNNLLTVINGYSERLLRALPQGHAERNKVEQIKDAGQRAALLTRQILAFSRKQPLTPIVFNLNDAVARMDQLLRRLIGEHITLVTDPDPGLGRVKADQGQIEHVIMNLAVNARDAMSNGGTLTIETRNADLDEAFARTHPQAVPGPYVQLLVRDTGCGMDHAVQARVFEPFFTTKEPGKGTGLGLAMVYGIVTQSGGTIWVESEVGKGSTFSIALPRVPDPAALEP